jgi:hypothetical protein
MVDDLEAYAHKINSKISEEAMLHTYKALSNKKVKDVHPGVKSHYPVPRPKDYNKGFIRRHFFIRYDGGITEVSSKEASRKKTIVPRDLYTYVIVKWRIVDSVVIPTGVFKDNPTTADVNEFYIREGSKTLSTILQRTFRQYFYDLEAFKLST